jgi:hypothetical protein
VRCQHTRKQFGLSYEGTHHPTPQAFAMLEHKYQARHHSRAPSQRAVACLVRSEVPRRQASGQQIGLLKGKAKPLAGYRVDAARGVADQGHSSVTNPSQPTRY